MSTRALHGAINRSLCGVLVGELGEGIKEGFLEKVTSKPVIPRKSQRHKLWEGGSE